MDKELKDDLKKIKEYLYAITHINKELLINLKQMNDGFRINTIEKEPNFIKKFWRYLWRR